MVMGLAVPVFVNFEGFTRLMASVDIAVLPFIVPNYDHNRGVSGGWNSAIRRARETNVDALLISNDDIYFHPGCLANLYGHFKAVEGIDLLTAYNVRDGWPETDGILDAADFSAFMIDPHTFTDKFGWFDEKFSPAYFEDNDMAYRIKMLGGRYGQDTSATMWHEGSVTQNWNGEPYVSSEMFETNRAYYITKWGGQPGEERYKAPYNGITGKTPKDW